MYEKNIAEGMKWLDQAKPGWWKDINTGYLDLRKYDRCVLGQLFGEDYTFNACYTQGESLGVSRGFILSAPTPERPYEHPDRYPLLTDEWRAAIRMRRETAAAEANVPKESKIPVTN